MYILHFTFKHVFKKVGDFDFWQGLVQFYKSEVNKSVNKSVSFIGGFAVMLAKPVEIERPFLTES